MGLEDIMIALEDKLKFALEDIIFIAFILFLLILPIFLEFGIKNQGKRIAQESGQITSTTVTMAKVIPIRAEPIEVSRSKPKNHQRIEVMVVTSYCDVRNNCADGTRPGPGTVAVDPKIIPLGTRMYIPGYGNAVAHDTGGLIKGNRLDIWLPTKEQCIQWGRQEVQVIIYYE